MLAKEPSVQDKSIFLGPSGCLGILRCEGLTARLNYLICRPLSFSHPPCPILQQILPSHSEYVLSMTLLPSPPVDPSPSLHRLSFDNCNSSLTALSASTLVLYSPFLTHLPEGSYSNEARSWQSWRETLHSSPSHSESEPKSTPWSLAVLLTTSPGHCQVLHSSHTGRLAISQTCQAPSYIKAFLLAAPLPGVPQIYT